jgi:AcrR family transcriptional regulator
MPARLRPGTNDPATDALRERVVGAARTVLLEAGATAMSLDAIAARAGVARTIVLQQFGSVAGVLEALFDWATERGCLSELPKALERSEPEDTIAEVIAIYARFWDAERELFRRLAAVAAFDAELRSALRKRAEQRQQGLRNVSRKLAQKRAPLSAQALDVLSALTSFGLLDALAGPDRTLGQVVPIAQQLARAVLVDARS